MKKAVYLCWIFAAVSCVGNRDKMPADVALDSECESSVSSVKGKWLIENVVVDDTLCLRSSDKRCYFNFHDDGTFGISTNCNSSGGEYRICGDSISFTNVCWTEMACDDMTMEDMLKKVIPNVCVIDISNDSIAQLNTNTAPRSCIIIKKSSD